MSFPSASSTLRSGQYEIPWWVVGYIASLGKPVTSTEHQHTDRTFAVVRIRISDFSGKTRLGCLSLDQHFSDRELNHVCPYFIVGLVLVSQVLGPQIGIPSNAFVYRSVSRRSMSVTGFSKMVRVM